MGAAVSQTAKRFGLAFSPANEKPMPRGMTSHMPQTPFMAITACRPKAPQGSGTPHHLNHNCPKGKMAGNRFLPYQFNA
jgi:hypothetical protein